MNNDRKKKNSGGSPVGLILVIVFFLISVIDTAGASILLIVIIGGAVFAAVYFTSKAKKAQSGSTHTESSRREAEPQQFDMGRLIKQNKGSLSKLLTEKMRDDLSECDDDHEHAEPDFCADPGEKRAAQLREMLKNGIIEKDEYNILMRKYGLK